MQGFDRRRQSSISQPGNYRRALIVADGIVIMSVFGACFRLCLYLPFTIIGGILTFISFGLLRQNLKSSVLESLLRPQRRRGLSAEACQSIHF